MPRNSENHIEHTDDFCYVKKRAFDIRQNSRNRGPSRKQGKRKRERKKERERERDTAERRKEEKKEVRAVGNRLHPPVLSILLASSSVLFVSTSLPLSLSLSLSLSRFPSRGPQPLFAILRRLRQGADGTLLNIVKASVSHLSSRWNCHSTTRPSFDFPPSRRQSHAPIH